MEALRLPENEMQPWYLVLGREYAIIAVLRDEDRHRMYLTPNVEFDIQYGIAVGKVEHRQ